MTSRSGGLTSRRYAAVTVSVLSLVTIIAFETMAVSTVMPRATTDLAAGPAYGLAFSLMFTGQLLGIALAGALAARRGPILTLWAGAGLFAAGSLLAGLTPTFAVLLGGRLLAGIGAGLCLVAIYVVIGAAYPITVRPTVFAWLASAWVLPSIVGPLVAAAMTDRFGWRSVFVVIAPLTALACAGITRAGRLLAVGPGPEYRTDLTEQESPATAMSLRRVTTYGVLMTLGAAAFQTGTSLPTLPYGVLAVATLGGLALLAWAVPPLMPRGTFAMRRGEPSVMLARFLLMASFNATVAFAPLMLVQALGLGLLQTGALLTLSSLGWAAGSFVQSRPGMAEKGPQLIHTGSVILVGGTVALLVTDLADWPVWCLGVCLTFIGLAEGVAVTSTSVLALELAPKGGHAAASASLQVADVLGSVMGIAVASGAYAAGSALGLGNAITFPAVWAIAAIVAAMCVPTAYRVAPRRVAAAQPLPHAGPPGGIGERRDARAATRIRPRRPQ